MKIALFAGAGFSRPFGHPVMREFLGFANACPRIDQEDRTLLGRLVLEARGANAFLESSATNLEDILSFYEMGSRLGLDTEEPQRAERLKQIIAKVYTASRDIAGYWNRYAYVEDFLGSKLKDLRGQLSFVTTNYDLNLECACYKPSVYSNPGFALDRIEGGQNYRGDALYHPSGIPLFKLHGSVNWFLDEDQRTIKVEDRLVRIENIEAGERLYQLPRPCCGNFSAPGIPLIIPPSFLKPDLPDALRTIWRNAAKALAEAHVVVFVGYSFPPSDTEMMYFLARALSENATLRAVYVVDIRASALVERMQSPGSKMGSHFRDLLIPLEGDWRKVELPLGDSAEIQG